MYYCSSIYIYVFQVHSSLQVLRHTFCVQFLSVPHTTDVVKEVHWTFKWFSFFFNWWITLLWLLWTLLSLPVSGIYLMHTIFSRVIICNGFGLNDGNKTYVKYLRLEYDGTCNFGKLIHLYKKSVWCTQIHHTLKTNWVSLKSREKHPLTQQHSLSKRLWKTMTHYCPYD